MSEQAASKSQRRQLVRLRRSLLKSDDSKESPAVARSLCRRWVVAFSATTMVVVGCSSLDSERTAYATRESYRVANRQVMYGSSEPSLRIVDASNAAKWRVQKIQFENEPLADVLLDLQRYTDKQIIFQDKGLLAIRITGELSTVDIWDSLQRLQKHPEIQVEQVGETFVVRHREATLPTGLLRQP